MMKVGARISVRSQFGSSAGESRLLRRAPMGCFGSVLNRRFEEARWERLYHTKGTGPLRDPFATPATDARGIPSSPGGGKEGAESTSREPWRERARHDNSPEAKAARMKAERAANGGQPLWEIWLAD